MYIQFNRTITNYIISLLNKVLNKIVKLSRCAPWGKGERRALSGTCPVKPLYGLGHRAAAQFQGFGNLRLAYAIIM